MAWQHPPTPRTLATGLRLPGGGQPIDPADAAWLAARCCAAIEGGMLLREVFGLPARGGAGGLTRVARLANRDALLRVAAYRMHFAHLEPRAAARAILEAISRGRRARHPGGSPADVMQQLAAGEDLPRERRVANVLSVVR